MRWNVGVMWNGVPKCGGVNRCELWCDVKCGATDVECCHFRHGEMWTEMQNVRRGIVAWCGMWCPGMWNVA